MVAVISKTGKRLMPTSEYKARKLLKSKKAVICNYKPFAIRLLNNVTEDTQPIEFSMDTGYTEIGLSVASLVLITANERRSGYPLPFNIN